MYASPLDGLLEILKSCGTGAIVCFGDEVFNLRLVAGDGGLEVGEVEVRGALHAGENEVEMGEEAEPGEEGDPGGDEAKVGFDKVEQGKDDPVHEPWC